MLVESKADVNAERDDGETPLFMAARNGRHKIVNILAQNGANINLKINDDLSPLNLAALHGKFVF